jgi:RimJ/RimL family protein N-acetyltransferase
VLARHAHGKGYATEALGAVLAWGDRHFGPVKTVCLIRPDNTASIRVALKCGYVERQRAAYKEQPTIIFIRDPRA